MKILGSATVILTCGLLSACQDLTIPDTNRPSLAVSLGTAANLETTVQGAANYFFGGVEMGTSVNESEAAQTSVYATFMPVLEGWNDESTFGGRAPTLNATTVLDEPRGTFDHNSDQFLANKAPFQDGYAAIAACHDVRQAILVGKDGAAPISGVAFPQSERSAYFCKLIMGFAHLYEGLLYDKGFLVPDDLKDIDINNHRFFAHDSVIEFAKTMIHQGIAEAVAAPPTQTLTTWINGAVYSNVDMAKVAYGYLARAEIFKAATKEQRADISQGGVVDWKKVKAYVDSSLGSTWTATYVDSTGKATVSNANMPVANPLSAGFAMPNPNFTEKGSTTITQARNSDASLMQNTAQNNYYRMHHKMLGPGDTTGAYLDFLTTAISFRHDTTYASPDKRLPRGPCNVINGIPQTYPQGGCQQRHGNLAGSLAVTAVSPGDGNYFQIEDAGQEVTFNGNPNNLFRQASYVWIRFGASAIARRSNSSTLAWYYADFQPLMTTEEQDLLRAESYMRLGDNASAVPLINKTRIDPHKGGLPPVGVNGTQEPYPQCVPHSFSDARLCGNLYDALLWEKRMEEVGTDGFLNWSDWRSFGMLDPGTPIYFPPSYRETQQDGLPYYTYGGPLPGSSDAAAQCGTDLTVYQNIGCTNYKSVGRLPKPPQ